MRRGHSTYIQIDLYGRYEPRCTCGWVARAARDESRARRFAARHGEYATATEPRGDAL